MTYQIQCRTNNGSSLIKKAIIYPAIGLGLIGAIVTHEGLQPSDNLTRNLRNPVTVCLNMPDYAGREFIRQYRKEIIEYSKRYKVPSEFVATFLLSENYTRQRYQDWKDKLATGSRARIWDTYFAGLFGKISKTLGPTDPSLGPAQIKVSTAMSLDEKFEEGKKTRDKLENLLQDPVINIAYLAKNTSDLIHRDNRLLNATVQEIFNNPHAIAVIGSEYVRGGTSNPLSNSKPNVEGLSYAALMAITDFKELLGQGATITEIQQKGIGAYVKKQMKINPELRKRIKVPNPKKVSDYYSKLPC